MRESARERERERKREGETHTQTQREEQSGAPLGDRGMRLASETHPLSVTKVRVITRGSKPRSVRIFITRAARALTESA